MKRIATGILALAIIVLAAVSVISCLKHKQVTVISRVDDQTIYQYGDWNDIRSGNYQVALYGCDADTKFRECIVLPTTYRQNYQGSCHPPTPELNERH